MSQQSDRSSQPEPTEQPQPEAPRGEARPAPADLDARLEQEIEAALGDLSLDDMLDEPERSTEGRRAPSPPGAAGEPAAKRPAPGQRQRKTGTVQAIHGDLVLVEFGPKSQGMCPLGQFPEPPAIGTSMEFNVERFDRREGLLVLSRAGAVQKAEWESLEVGQIVEARCTGMNKGGLEMEVANHRAFMPAGQVDVRHIRDISVFIGEKMPCEVVEVDRQRGRIILSRKSVLEAERTELRKKLLEELEVGQQRPAVITSIQNYGAFADLGGIDGLIHISDLSYERIKHPSQAVKEGDQITVRVLKIDHSQDPPRIGLGMKQTMADPYQSQAAAISEGEVVTGKVTKLMAFGAFVEIAPGVEGLIHISELSHDRVGRVGQVVKPGQVVKAKVLSIDPEKRRIALSLKQMQERIEDQDDPQFARKEDPHLRKLKAQLSRKFGELRGGIG